MDRFERFGYYARARGRGVADNEAPRGAWVAEAIGMIECRKHCMTGETIMTVDELDAELRRVGVLQEEEGVDVPGVEPSERDDRNLEECRARLQGLILAGGRTDTGGRWLFDAAADEIVRLRGSLDAATRLLDKCDDSAGERREELRQAKEALEQARAKVDELRETAERLSHQHQRDEERLREFARREGAAAREQGAAEMRERAAVVVDGMTAETCTMSGVAILKGDTARAIRALSLVATAPAAPGLTEDERAYLLRLGYVERAGTWKHMWAGPAYDMAKPEDLTELRRELAEHRELDKTELSAEDAKTLRGAGWRMDGNAWRHGPSGSAREINPTNIESLRCMAAELRAVTIREKAPAVAHEQPGKVTGAEAATAGASSLAEDRGAAQGTSPAPGQDTAPHGVDRGQALPKPKGVVLGQRWRFAHHRLDLRVTDSAGVFLTDGVGSGFTTTADEMLTSPRWTFLGGPSPQDPSPKRDGERMARADLADALQCGDRDEPMAPAFSIRGANAPAVERDMNAWVAAAMTRLVVGREGAEAPAGVPAEASDRAPVFVAGPVEVHGDPTPRGAYVVGPVTRGHVDHERQSELREEEPSDLEKITALQAKVDADIRASAARASGGTSHPEALTSADGKITLIIRGGVEAREVAAVCIELLGLPDVEPIGPLVPSDPDGNDPRSLEQIDAVASEMDRDAPVTASRVRAYARGIREGERRAKVKAVELQDRWNATRARAAESGNVVKANATLACILHLRAAFGITDAPTDPGKPPTGEPTPEAGTVSRTSGGVTITALDGMTLGEVWDAIRARAEMRVCLEAELRQARESARGTTPADLEAARRDIRSAVLEDAFRAGGERAHADGIVDGLNSARGIFAKRCQWHLLREVDNDILDALAKAGARIAAADAALPSAPDRETLGREVHEVWLDKRQDATGERPALTFEDLDDDLREHDRNIGERLFNMGVRWATGEGDAELTELARLIDDEKTADARALLEKIAARRGEADAHVAAARWELAMAERRDPDADLLEALRVFKTHADSGNPHMELPADDLAGRIFGLGVEPGELERDGARHVAKVLLEVIERQWETLKRNGLELAEANRTNVYLEEQRREHMTTIERLSRGAGAATRLFPVTPGPLAELSGRIEGVIVKAFSEDGDGERRGPAAVRWILRLVDEHLQGSASTTEAPAQCPTLEALRELAVSFRRNEAMAAARVDKHPDGTRGEPFHDGRRIAFAYCVKALCRVAGIEPPPSPPSPQGPQGTPGPSAQDGSAGDQSSASTWDWDRGATGAEQARHTAALDAAQLARRWLTPRLNMLALAERPGTMPEQVMRADGIAAAWRSAIRDLCKVFNIQEPQPDGPGAEIGVALLQLDEERRRLWLATSPAPPVDDRSPVEREAADKMRAWMAKMSSMASKAPAPDAEPEHPVKPPCSCTGSPNVHGGGPDEPPACGRCGGAVKPPHNAEQGALQQAIDCWNLVASEGKRVEEILQGVDCSKAGVDCAAAEAHVRDALAALERKPGGTFTPLATFTGPKAMTLAEAWASANRGAWSSIVALGDSADVHGPPSAAPSPLPSTPSAAPAAVTAPRIELRDGAEVTVGSRQLSDCGEHGPVHGVICTAHIDGQHVTERGRAGDGLGSWHVLERWPIEPASPEPCATCGGSGEVSAMDYTGNTEPCDACEPASPETPDPRWEPGAVWETYGKRYTIGKALPSARPTHARFIGLLADVEFDHMIEANGWRYVGPVDPRWEPGATWEHSGPDLNPVRFELARCDAASRVWLRGSLSRTMVQPLYRGDMVETNGWRYVGRE